MENIGWTDRVTDGEALTRVTVDRNILHTINSKNGNRTGHIVGRNCFLKHVIEGNMEGNTEGDERRGKGRKQLLDNLKEMRKYCRWKQEALDRTLWRTSFGRGYGPVVGHTTWW
jgi:hypothetical protein